jgi:hypothetical protein
MAVRNISRSFILALEAYTYINLLPESASTDMAQRKQSKQLRILTYQRAFQHQCYSQVHEGLSPAYAVPPKFCGYSGSRQDLQSH